MIDNSEDVKHKASDRAGSTAGAGQEPAPASQRGSGFERLRGLGAAGVMGLASLFGGGTARGASTAIPLTVTRGAVTWKNIDNNNSFPSSVDTTTTTNGDSYPSHPVGGSFGISDAAFSNGATTFNDAFDNALILGMDGTRFSNPDGTVDLSGDTVTSDVVFNLVPGVNAQIQYRFFPGRPVVRALFSLTNTTGAALPVDPVILSDFGSDDSTTVQATSDGDAVIENTDMWYLTDDGGGAGSDPRILTTRYGAGAVVVPLNALTPESSSDPELSGLRYPVTIPAGATVRILVFMELSDPSITTAGAIASAADFTSTAALQSAGLLVGMTQNQIDEVVNYSSSLPPAVAPSAVPLFSSVGLLSVIGLLGGAGMFELRRRRKR